LLAQTPKKPVTDTYDKVTVTDDYRWLENFDDPAVKQWADAQNAAARKVLDALPDRDALARELRQIFQPAKARYFPIEQRGGKIFAMKSDQQHQHQIVVTLDSLDDLGSEHTVLDPDAIDAQHLTEIDFAVPSVDGRYLAASLSTGGSESGDVHVYETATGKALPEVIARVNFATAGGGLVWNSDSSGFYYTRYPRDGERAGGGHAFLPADLLSQAGRQARERHLRNRQGLSPHRGNLIRVVERRPVHRPQRGLRRWRRS
jgi:prolyl oligopeptidase